MLSFTKIMEASVDLSSASDEEIRAEIDGMQKFLDALLSGASLNGREQLKKAELIRKIGTYKSELNKRNAPRS